VRLTGWRSACPIHGGDSAPPNVVDTGIGHPQVLGLLDPHGLVIDLLTRMADLGHPIVNGHKTSIFAPLSDG
jgi:hypothetical protein